jgi:hypothetical protein
LIALALSLSLSLSLTGTYKPSSFDVYRILKELFGTIAEMIELYSAPLCSVCVRAARPSLSLSLSIIYTVPVY